MHQKNILICFTGWDFIPEIKNGDINDTYYKDVYPPSEMGLNYYDKLKMSFPENEGLKNSLRAYLACIAFMDDQVGKVLNALKIASFQKILSCFN